MCFTHGVLIGAGAAEKRLVLTYPELIISITIIVTATLSTAITITVIVTSIITSFPERAYAFFYARPCTLSPPKDLLHSQTSRKHEALPCILFCRLLRILLNSGAHSGRPEKTQSQSTTVTQST